ncbi:MAG: GNAT family N-acetyltransferase [Roseivirga sp.]|nr:GNAT family N-acetyltransferase [Roseivirga sp.]
MDYLFQSPRLGFRHWQKNDLAPFAAINADSEVMEFFPSIQSLEQTREAIQRYQQHFEAHGYGWYAVDLLETGTFAGFIGFSKVTMDVSFGPCVEIGWRFAQTYWGKGLATEGAKACLRYGWETLGFTEVYSFTASINKRSARVMEKLGMSYQGNFLHPKLEKDHSLEEHVLYKIECQK